MPTFIVEESFDILESFIVGQGNDQRHKEGTFFKKGSLTRGLANKRENDKLENQTRVQS